MNFYQYLNKNGLLHILAGTDDKIDEIRRIYRKEYKKEYKKKYQQERIHRVVIFTHEEYELLKRASDNYKLGFSTFVRESAIKYLSRGYIIPDKEQTKSVLVAFKRYGTLLNQIAHIVNSTKKADLHHIKMIQDNFSDLEKELKQIFTEPVPVDDLLKRVITKEPQYIDKIQSILNSHKQ